MEWFDTGREMEYVFTGGLELHLGATFGAQGAGEYLYASAGEAQIGIVDEEADYRLVVQAGNQIARQSIPDWESSYIASYVITIRMKEQVRLGRKPLFDANGAEVTLYHPPVWRAEWRQVYQARPDDAEKGYCRVQVRVQGHSELDLDGWADRAFEGEEDSDFPTQVLAVSANMAAMNTEPRLMARATGSPGGFLDADFRGQEGVHRPCFTAQGVEMWAGLGNVRDDTFRTTLGPLWQIESRIAVQRWDLAYAGAVVESPFLSGYYDGETRSECGSPVRYSADSSGVAQGTVSGRYQEIYAPGFVYRVRDGRPLRGGTDIRYGLESQWMESAGEFHYEERLSADGRRYVTKRFDSDVLISDPVKPPFPIATLKKLSELVIDSCESTSGWRSGEGAPEIALGVDARDKSEGMASLRAIVDSRPGSARELICSSGAGAARHFRYLSLDVKAPPGADTLSVRVEGSTRSRNSDAISDSWLTGAQWRDDPAGDMWQVPLSLGDAGGVVVTSLESGWLRVRIDLAANESPGWGLLLDSISAVRLEGLAPGEWRFDKLCLLVATDAPMRPACWWAVDQQMRELGANLPDGTALWEWVGAETELRERNGVPTPFVTADLYEDACFRASTNGCRSLRSGSFRKRIPTDPMEPVSYPIRTIGEVESELLGQGNGGWELLEEPSSAPYDVSQWSLVLTYDFQRQGETEISLMCRPKYHEISLYARSDWVLGGMKVLQGAVEGLAFDSSNRRALSGAQVQVSRDGGPVLAAITEPSGYYLARPVPHSDLVSGLALDGPDGELLQVDTRYDLRLLLDGRVISEAPKALFVPNRALEWGVCWGVPPAVSGRVCLEIGRLGASYIGWAENGTLMLRRSLGLADSCQFILGAGSSPWVVCNERSPGLLLDICYEREGMIHQRTSTDGGAQWGDEMSVGLGSNPFFKHDAVTGITCYAFSRTDGIYFRRSADGGKSFLEPEYRILAGVPEQAVCFDFTKDHEHGIRLLYRDLGGVLRTIYSWDGGRSWESED